MVVLENLFYTKDHEWIKVEGEKAYIGITDFAQNALGDIVFVDTPEVDDEFEIEDAFGAVESVKAASDVFMPVSGKIVEVNETVIDNPEAINEAPYENWIICVELKDKSQLDNLMKAKEYEAVCSEEE